LRTRQCLSCPILSGYQLRFDSELNAYIGMPNEKSSGTAAERDVERKNDKR
jgi:hypothetical protein